MGKKLLALLLALVCVMAMVSCGSSEPAETDEGAAEEAIHPMFINSEPYTIEAATADERGFQAVTCSDDGNYKVTITNPEGEDYKWVIYLADEKFEDATRYIPDAMEPALEGEGTIEIKADQYIYIYTSANSFELGDKEIPKDAYLQFDYAE